MIIDIQDCLFSTSNYSPSHSMQTLLDWIDKYINDKDMPLQLKPDFQREYVWTEEQKVKFIEYVILGGHVPPLYFNQAGWQTTWKGEFVCVDGLQRITAIKEFSEGKFRVLRNYTLRNGQKIDEHGVGIKDIFGINGYMPFTVIVNNLKTKREVLLWYVGLNNGGTVHTEDEINRVREMLNEQN